MNTIINCMQVISVQARAMDYIMAWIRITLSVLRALIVTVVL